MSLSVCLEKPCCSCGECSEEVYDANITHNLTSMAAEAGIYKHLWRPGPARRGQPGATRIDRIAHVSDTCH